MPCRYVALVLAIALAACQQSGPANENGNNQSQNTTVPLGGGNGGGNTVNPTVPPTGPTEPSVTVPGDDNQPTTNPNPGALPPVTQPGASATFDANGVQYLGRVASATNLLTWPGSGIVASFNGTSAQLSFTPQTGNTYLGISVDGAAPTRVLVNGNNVINTGTLRSGVHKVTAIKLNEASLGTAKFNGVMSRTGLIPTAAPTRRIEFIGDSITVGYGIEGVSPCTNNGSLENASRTYGALTAQALGAEYDLIAWSGKGLMRNAASVGNDVSPIMPTLWGRLAATDANSVYDFPLSRAPDAVVVNLGTNDFTYIGYNAAGEASTVRGPLDPVAFQAAYADFIQKVRAKYPSAFIELCSSPMLSDNYPTAAEAQHTTQVNVIKAVVAQLGDANMRFIDFPTETVGPGLNGCDSHPSPAQHAAMATLLTAQLKADLGW